MTLILDGLIPRMEAWVQEELLAQRKVLENLKRQEVVLLATELNILEELIAEGRALRAATKPRDRRRHMLLKDFERVWGVSAANMTLGSIAARLGTSGRRLATLRKDLKEVVTEIAQLAQRVRTFARYHQGVIQEVVEDVLERDGQLLEEGGALVNTEA